MGMTMRRKELGSNWVWTRLELGTNCSNAFGGMGRMWLKVNGLLATCGRRREFEPSSLLDCRLLPGQG